MDLAPNRAENRHFPSFHTAFIGYLSWQCSGQPQHLGSKPASDLLGCSPPGAGAVTAQRDAFLAKTTKGSDHNETTFSASAIALIAATGAHADGHRPPLGTLGATGVGAQAPNTDGLISPIEIRDGFSLDIGGFFQSGMWLNSASGQAPGGGADVSGFDGFDTYANFELHFSPIYTLDNGLTIGGVIELEGQTGGDTIDEAYGFAEGSFGRVELGDVNSVGSRLHVTAPYVGVLQDSEAGYPLHGLSGLSASVGDFFRATLGTTRLETLRANDATRVNYYSPDLNGFIIGVGFAGDGNQDSFGPAFTTPGSGRSDNFFDVAVQYSGQVGAGVLTASARYGTATSNVTPAPGSVGTNPYVYGVGFNYEVANFSIGGSAAHAVDHATGDGASYDFGVAYLGQDYTVALTYFAGENNDRFDAVTSTFSEENWQAINLSGQYHLKTSATAFVIGGGLTVNF